MAPRGHIWPTPIGRRGKKIQMENLCGLMGILLISLFLLAGCSSIFGEQNQAQETPVALPTYAPDAEAEVAEVAEVPGQVAAAPADTSANTAAANSTAAKNASTEAAPAANSPSMTATVQSAASTDSATTGDVAENPAADASGNNTASSTTVVRGDYNGEVVADDTVSIMAEVNGLAQEVTVDVGDRVAKGQVLVRVDTAMLEAQRAQALAGLEGAQAQLEQMLRSADEEDVAAAQAAINAASAAYSEVTKGASSEDLRIAESQIQQAEAAVRRARAAYNDVKWNPKIAMLPQSLELQNATLQLESAQAQYDKVIKGATDDRIAGAYAQLVQARTQLTNLQEGAKPEQVRAMQAQVNQAEVGLYMAQLQLDKATIKAPMEGIVTQVNISTGGMVSPGAPLLVMRTPNVDIVISVEELRLPTITIGQQALVRANAYPDRVFQGEISKIAPQLDPQTRTIQVTIQPTEPAEELLPGMFAAVDLMQE